MPLTIVVAREPSFLSVVSLLLLNNYDKYVAIAIASCMILAILFQLSHLGPAGRLHEPAAESVSVISKAGSHNYLKLLVS